MPKRSRSSSSGSAKFPTSTRRYASPSVTTWSGTSLTTNGGALGTSSILIETVVSLEKPVPSKARYWNSSSSCLLPSCWYTNVPSLRSSRLPRLTSFASIAVSRSRSRSKSLSSTLSAPDASTSTVPPRATAMESRTAKGGQPLAQADADRPSRLSNTASPAAAGTDFGRTRVIFTTRSPALLL